MDTLSPKERSERMGRVRAKHTRPELVVRRLVRGHLCASASIRGQNWPAEY
jgi:G:T-mismatch repair DNA endonuclease (very short patch repair protein)